VATYALIHGASSDAWSWHRVIPLLEELGHDVVAPSLPWGDDSAGWSEYADLVVEAIGRRDGVVVVGQSLGAFTAALVCSRIPVDLLVLVTPMIPNPQESAGEWWANTGYENPYPIRDDDGNVDPLRAFFHDVPPAVVAAAMAREEVPMGERPFIQPLPLETWPDVPTRVLLGRNDRFFPVEFQRRVVQERLGVTPEEMDSGHLPALARPAELVDRLERYRLARST
jgi:pimeloyl-ACP methyl ester carboxylesterase